MYYQSQEMILAVVFAILYSLIQPYSAWEGGTESARADFKFIALKDAGDTCT